MKNILKRIVAVALSAAMLAILFAMTSFASAPESPSVYVTISDESGKVVLAWEKVELTDADGDGALTVNDALYLAHEKGYKGGAAEGYASSETEYGLSLKKLWGTENGGSYGYYVDNKASFSLADTLSGGEHIYAFVYTDLTAWSDQYVYFDVYEVNASKGDTVRLTLSGIVGYDESYNPVIGPISGAVITVDGTATDVKTDENGVADIKLDKAGNYIISAESDNLTLVPPVVNANVEAGLGVIWYIVIVVVVVGVIGAAIAVSRTKKEK